VTEGALGQIEEDSGADSIVGCGREAKESEWRR